MCKLYQRPPTQSNARPGFWYNMAMKKTIALFCTAAILPLFAASAEKAIGIGKADNSTNR